MSEEKSFLERSGVVDEVVNEYLRASNKFAPFNSAHEGFAVLKEEVDELWDEVKKNPAKVGEQTRRLQMRAEAIKVAAMALRFLHDCAQKEREDV